MQASGSSAGVNQQQQEEMKSSQVSASGGGGGIIQNTFSKLYYLSSFVPYYGHEFSFARLRNADVD